MGIEIAPAHQKGSHLPAGEYLNIGFQVHEVHSTPPLQLQRFNDDKHRSIVALYDVNTNDGSVQNDKAVELVMSSLSVGHKFPFQLTQTVSPASSLLHKQTLLIVATDSSAVSSKGCTNQ